MALKPTSPKPISLDGFGLQPEFAGKLTQLLTWCQAHGLGGAKNFGPASDITSAIVRTSASNKISASATKAAVKPVREDDVYISCGE